MYENQQHVGHHTYKGACQWILYVSFLKTTRKTSTPNVSQESTIKAVYKNNEQPGRCVFTQLNKL